MGDIPRPDSATSTPRSEREEDPEPPANAGEVKHERTEKDAPLDEPREDVQDVEVVRGTELLVIIQLLAAINQQNNSMIKQNDRIIKLLKGEKDG
jgi:hypothetical protein